MARYIVDSQIDNHEKYYFIREQESQDIVLRPSKYLMHYVGELLSIWHRSSWERRMLERFWRWNAMWQMNILLWKMKRLRWQNARCYRDC